MPAHEENRSLGAFPSSRGAGDIRSRAVTAHARPLTRVPDLGMNREKFLFAFRRPMFADRIASARSTKVRLRTAQRDCLEPAGQTKRRIHALGQYSP